MKIYTLPDIYKHLYYQQVTNQGAGSFIDNISPGITGIQTFLVSKSNSVWK